MATSTANFRAKPDVIYCRAEAVGLTLRASSARALPWGRRSAAPSAGGKAVYRGAVFADLALEANVTLAASAGGRPGLIVRAARLGDGLNSLRGYCAGLHHGRLPRPRPRQPRPEGPGPGRHDGPPGPGLPLAGAGRRGAASPSLSTTCTRPRTPATTGPTATGSAACAGSRPERPLTTSARRLDWALEQDLGSDR
ncbi:hypothetical protein CDD83_10056 [Cordyceps sp. RAO-2017]|nr:hypothetical protein CDD83_10056 [Cordyceps sp. RAO-2017]